VVSESKQAIDFITYLQNFWDYDISSYVKEKLRKSHSIHRNYTRGQKLTAEKHWTPFFKGRFLGDITRQDIEDFIDNLAGKKLSASRKNIVLKAGTIPLRWAFSKEIIDKDVAANITWFSGKPAERHILSPEIVQALFMVEWQDERAMLANMLAAITGLRAGEIQALQVQDLGNDCLYIRHSWNGRDGLKTTKNNEERVVEVPFPSVINALLNLAGRNPHGVSMDSYVFWARQSSSKPMDGIRFLTGLRNALEKTGMSHASASVYVFHGWRHYFTAYMRDKLTEKLLQSQTGHKTIPMLDHYADHIITGDRERIRQAKMDVFGSLIPKGIEAPKIKQ
jgi:integrase